MVYMHIVVGSRLSEVPKELKLWRAGEGVELVANLLGLVTGVGH